MGWGRTESVLDRLQLCLPLPAWQICRGCRLLNLPLLPPAHSLTPTPPFPPPPQHTRAHSRPLTHHTHRTQPTSSSPRAAKWCCWTWTCPCARPSTRCTSRVGAGGVSGVSAVWGWGGGGVRRLSVAGPLPVLATPTPAKWLTVPASVPLTPAAPLPHPLPAGIASAPLWDGERGRVCGMLSASDFIHMLLVRGRGGGAAPAAAARGQLL